MPDRPRMPKESDETLHSTEGPHPPRRDKRPEHAYPAFERKDSTNRRDPGAPGGPVNIGVKGKAAKAGPDAAQREAPQATGRGTRDAPGGLPEE